MTPPAQRRGKGSRTAFFKVRAPAVGVLRKLGLLLQRLGVTLEARLCLLRTMLGARCIHSATFVRSSLHPLRLKCTSNSHWAARASCSLWHQALSVPIHATRPVRYGASVPQ